MAERLGMTVGELSGRMTAAELMMWIERDRSHVPDSWYQNALLRLTVCRLAGNRSARLEDFLPRAPSRAGGPADLPSRLLAFAAAHNRAVALRGAASP